MTEWLNLEDIMLSARHYVIEKQQNSHRKRNLHELSKIGSYKQRIEWWLLARGW